MQQHTKHAVVRKNIPMSYCRECRKLRSRRYDLYDTTGIASRITREHTPQSAEEAPYF